MTNRAPIGVFDSGVGGLSVLRALRAAMPAQNYIYLGDTARLPYGTKSAQSVLRYSLQCAAILVARGIRCLVVACNTASASALDALRAQYPCLAIVGVIEPGAAAAVAASNSMHIAVIATEGTIRGGAYQAALRRLSPRVQVTAQACSLLVALAEEGWVDGAVPHAVLRRYLDPIFSGPAMPDTLVLGCTHFPAMGPAIKSALPPGITVVDSTATTAAAVKLRINEFSSSSGDACRGTVSLLATDNAERFSRVGSLFLGETLDAGAIELIDL